MEERKMKLIPFDLQKYLKGGVKLVTRKGLDVRVSTLNGFFEIFEIDAFVKEANGEEHIHSFDTNGKCKHPKDPDLDLFIKEED